MTYDDTVQLVKSFSSECTEEYILHEIKKIIEEGRFSIVLRNYNMSKNMFASLYDYAKEYDYVKRDMLRYSNEHNKQIINEFYNKYEIFN